MEIVNTINKKPNILSDKDIDIIDAFLKEKKIDSQKYLYYSTKIHEELNNLHRPLEIELVYKKFFINTLYPTMKKLWDNINMLYEK